MFKKEIKDPNSVAHHTKEFEELKKKINKIVSNSNSESKKKKVDTNKLETYYIELSEAFKVLNELAEKVTASLVEDTLTNKYEVKMKTLIDHINQCQSKTCDDLKKMPVSNIFKLEVEKKDKEDKEIKDDQKQESLGNIENNEEVNENSDLKAQKNIVKINDADDNDEEEEEEVVGEKEKEDDDDVVQNKNLELKSMKYTALEDFEGETDGDLGFKKGDILSIICNNRNDGWLEAMNKKGAKGLVPSNYLQECLPLPENTSDNYDNTDDEDNANELSQRSKQGGPAKDLKLSLKDDVSTQRDVISNDENDDDNDSDDTNDDDKEIDVDKKEKSTDCDSALIPLLCVNG